MRYPIWNNYILMNIAISRRSRRWLNCSWSSSYLS